MMDSMGPGKLVCHMQNPSYTCDEYLICIGLGTSISSVICKNLSYSGPSYPSSPVCVHCEKVLWRDLQNPERGAGPPASLAVYKNKTKSEINYK